MITMEELSSISPPIFNGNRNCYRALSLRLSCRDHGKVTTTNHPESYVCLALGCCWAVDRGLVRNVVGEPGTPQDRRSSFVFPDLHDIQDESVSNQLSKQIQSLVPTQLKSFMSVKSFRYGAISMLMWDPAVIYEECIALGG